MNQPRNIIDEYPVEAMLASSPQTTVYRSTDPKTGRHVVVKILSSVGSNGNQVERQHFLRAMGAVQFLRLPAFPELYDFGFSDDRSAFMVMEWVDGVSLDALQGGSSERTIPLLIQVVDALEALAMGEVFHHNLAPANILVTAGAGGEVAKIIGFGTSAFLSESAASSMLGHSPDSDSFIAPERLDPSSGRGSANAAADIYSLALLACEVLGGRLDSGDDGGPIVRFDGEAREQLAAVEGLENALSNALQIRAEDRMSSYPALRMALATALARSSEPTAADAAQSGHPTAFATMTRPHVETPAGAASPPPLPPRQPQIDPSADAEDRTRLVKGGPADGQQSEDTIVLPSTAIQEGWQTDETIVISPPDEAAEPDPSLDDTSHAFDPNKTDPVLQPEALRPPPIGAQPPPIAEVLGNRGAVSQKRKRTPGIVIVVVAVAACTLIIGGGILVLVRLSQRPHEPAVAEVVAPTAIPATPIPRPTPETASINSALEAADALVSAGDLEGARETLSSIPPETIAAFTEEESEVYAGINNALQGSRLDAAISDLEGGLTHGSIRMLQRAVTGLSRIDAREYRDRPGIAPKLAKARAILELHGRLWTAQESGNRRAVLEYSAAMIGELPAYSTPYTFRSEAAEALEKESDAAATAGDLDEAESLLAPIESYWPERDGLHERLATLASARDAMDSQLAVIEQALSKGWDGDPAAGLTVLQTVSPIPLLEQRFDKTRALLEEQLAERDKGPPRVTLADDIARSFKKKKPVIIELVVSDDYRVDAVSAFLKLEGETSYTKFNLTRATAPDRYRFDVSPEIHQNEDFFVYFEASDVSGHMGRLGDSRSPLEFTRKKGLKAIFGK